MGENSVRVILMDAQQHGLKDARVTLEADMAHPGMAPVFGKTSEERSGIYVGALYFNMPGDWVIVVHIALPDGRTLDKQIPLAGVHSDGTRAG